MSEMSTILNRQVYRKDPSVHKLVNEGVAKVNETQSEDELKILRYELETLCL
jgi:hypothetical protein